MQQVTARPSGAEGADSARWRLGASVSSRPWLRTDVRSARSQYALPPPRVWKPSQRLWRPRRHLAAGRPRAPSPPGLLAAALSGTAASSSSSNWIGRPGPGTVRNLASPRRKHRLRFEGRRLPGAVHRLDSTINRAAPTRSWTCLSQRNTNPKRSLMRTRTGYARSTLRRKEVSANRHVRSPSTIFTRAKVRVTSFFNSTSKRKTWQTACSVFCDEFLSAPMEISFLRKTNAEEYGVRETGDVPVLEKKN